MRNSKADLKVKISCPSTAMSFCATVSIPINLDIILAIQLQNFFTTKTIYNLRIIYSLLIPGITAVMLRVFCYMADSKTFFFVINIPFYCLFFGIFSFSVLSPNSHNFHFRKYSSSSFSSFSKCTGRGTIDLVTTSSSVNALHF